jgi:outer membrane murein-binding lipoprotein Lpp
MARRYIVLTVAACNLLLLWIAGGSVFADAAKFDTLLTDRLASSAIRITRLEEKLNELRSSLQKLQTTNYARESGIPFSSVF